MYGSSECPWKKEAIVLDRIHMGSAVNHPSQAIPTVEPDVKAPFWK